MQERQETGVWSLGREDPLEQEMASPVQYSCLGNPTGGGAWRATAHGAAKSQTLLGTPGTQNSVWHGCLLSAIHCPLREPHFSPGFPSLPPRISEHVLPLPRHRALDSKRHQTWTLCWSSQRLGPPLHFWEELPACDSLVGAKENTWPGRSYKQKLRSPPVVGDISWERRAKE